MLRRVEIDFVEAALAYARGEPVISDADYDVLKTKVLAAGEKRADVTALLLYTKGNQLLEPVRVAGPALSPFSCLGRVVFLPSEPDAALLKTPPILYYFCSSCQPLLKTVTQRY
jgi:hypothetical protein